MQGRLIAIEGIEGAGKSTQAKRLARALGAEPAREPGGTDLGEAVRRLLLNDGSVAVSARAELFLTLAARAQHLSERILPLLDSGHHVVVDRFTGSTVAYQGYGRQLPLEEVKTACGIATKGKRPDLNILLDIDDSVRARRRPTAGDRIEAEAADFHERVRVGFRAQAGEDPEHWVVVDGARSVSLVTSEILRAVSERLGLEPVGDR